METEISQCLSERMAQPASARNGQKMANKDDYQKDNLANIFQNITNVNFKCLFPSTKIGWYSSMREGCQ